MRKIKKSDKVIGDLKTNFIGPSGQYRDRVYYSFLGTRNSSSQGLCLVDHRKSGSKYFILRYWYDGKSKTYPLGQFVPGEYGVKEAQKDLEELRAKYGGKNYSFEHDISEQKKVEASLEKQNQLLSLSKMTVKDVILNWYNRGCPNIQRKGNVSKSQLTDLTNTLIGKHKRRDYMIVDENDRSEGFIRVLEKKYKRVGRKKGYRIHKTGLSTFDDLMAKYPPEENKDNKPGRAIIDNAIGDLWVERLSFAKAQNYIQLHPTRNAQIQAQKGLSYIWEEAKKMAALGENPGENPTHNQPITHNTNAANTSTRSAHVKQYLNQDQVDKFWERCEHYKHSHRFQPLAAKSILLAGLRGEEVLKIKCENIEFDNLVIYLDDVGTKLREESGIVMTPLLFQVFKELEEERKMLGLNFTGYAFPSLMRKTIKSKVDKESFKRLKGCSRFYRSISSDLGFTINSSVLKNTYHNIAAQNVKDDNDLIKLTRHKDPGVLHSNYISRKITQEVRDNANKVGEYFENIVQFKRKA